MTNPQIDPTSDLAASDAHAPLPLDSSFWGITATQFLGAFNDNIFKQTIMLIFVAIPLAGGEPRDLQWLATAVFSAPFVLFSGFAGFLSDRYSKRVVIVLCKVAEIVIMGAGIGAFFYFQYAGYSYGFVVLLSSILFCMGAQSAFFGPGKYGVLPELFHARDLPAANGVILMTTFLAIIFGTALAGILLDLFHRVLWIPGLFCILIAILGTGTSLILRKTEPAEPDVKFHPTSLTIPPEIRALLREDPALNSALITSCLFWATGALVQPIVNALGTDQLQLPSKTQVSMLVAVIGIGIALGSLICGLLSNGRTRWDVLRLGGMGIVVCLLLLSISLPGGGHWLGYRGSLVVLTLLGVCTGMFAVPLQVFMQSRPPRQLKGRMMATQNLLNWLAITATSALNWLFLKINAWFNWPTSTMFAMSSILMIIVVIWYRPQAVPPEE